MLPALLLSLVACTDAEMAKKTGLGNSFKVEVFSGGKPIRTYVSTGKVRSESSSDGYYFTDVATGKLVKVSGDVVITQLD